MPAPPLWLVENLWDRGQYPGHIITPSAEAVGFEATRLADGRRDETRYKGTTANSEVTLVLDCGVPRLVSAVFLDRGHTLGGKRWLLESSGDNFATTASIVLDVNPQPVNVGGRLTDPLGGLGLDGSWGIILAVPALARYYRVRVPAVSGYIPEVTGLAMGRHFQLGRSVPMPYADYNAQRFFQEQTSLAGRVGRSRTYRRRQGQLFIRAASDAEYTDNLRPWLEDTFRDLSAPAWLVLDPDLLVRGMLNVICPQQGDWAFALDTSVWPYPTAAVPFIENTPEVI